MSKHHHAGPGSIVMIENQDRLDFGYPKSSWAGRGSIRLPQVAFRTRVARVSSSQSSRQAAPSRQVTSANCLSHIGLGLSFLGGPKWPQVSPSSEFEFAQQTLHNRLTVTVVPKRCTYYTWPLTQKHRQARHRKQPSWYQSKVARSYPWNLHHHDFLKTLSAVHAQAGIISAFVRQRLQVGAIKAFSTHVVQVFSN